MAFLKVTDASGRQAQTQLNARTTYTIGRAPDNHVVLDDPRASRHHAHIKTNDDGSFMVIDGIFVNGQLKRSANKVYVNGEQKFEHQLRDGDRVTIGASTLKFEQAKEERTADLSYDDKPLGHTQLLMSAKDVLNTVLRQSDPSLTMGATSVPRGDKVLESLQRKANILGEIYEMSKALGAGFDLDKIFKMATDIIFRSTPADRTYYKRPARPAAHESAHPQRTPACCIPTTRGPRTDGRSRSRGRTTPSPACRADQALGGAPAATLNTGWRVATRYSTRCSRARASR